VDPNGVLYVNQLETMTISRYVPVVAPATPATNADFTKTSLKTENLTCQIAADGAGNVYSQEWTFGAQGGPAPARRFNAADFAAVPPTKSGTVVDPGSSGMAIDPSNNDVYMNEGNQIARYDSSGTLFEKFGAGKISGSKSIAFNNTTKNTYVPNGSNVAQFGYEEGVYHPIENVGVIHGAKQSGVRSFGDFQVSPDGRYAVFNSILPLTNFATSGHNEIYRYDASTDTLQCPSCANSEANPATDTSLPLYGQSLTDDGRVFFTTRESFALRDTNDKSDAYQWSGGRQQLISTGISPYDSSLLTVSADGTDAFFFTREKLVPEDANGQAVRIYDARAGGGFVFDPHSPPCAASDECHGAGTKAPAAPTIPTYTGSGSKPAPEKRCRKGFVVRHGKCVKRHRRKQSRGQRHTTGRNG
jgi:hypothetical protein